MAFKSEVRDSTINALLEKSRERSYGQYLAKLTLKKVRGFSDDPISFDFPAQLLLDLMAVVKQPYLVLQV